MMTATEPFDYAIVGSGFGGSVCALRLAQKGYRVIVLERGKRFNDSDFPKSNWNFRRYLWFPLFRCFGILELSLLKHAFVLHGAGVGGGSLGYANVLMEPDDDVFSSGTWGDFPNWKNTLAPHFGTAKKMLGATTNVHSTTADKVIEAFAESEQRSLHFRPTEVGVYFNRDATPKDPYFDGMGPLRSPCTLCSACLTGCRVGAKNTLPKNYLFFAEKLGATLQSETKVTRLDEIHNDLSGARYELTCLSSTAFLKGFHTQKIRAKNVIVSAGVLGTLKLLLRCRDRLNTLPGLSSRLGDRVRTNGESLVAVTASRVFDNYSEGVAITSTYVTSEGVTVQPTRYGLGSSALRFIASTRGHQNSLFARVASKFLPRWASRTLIFLIMGRIDESFSLRDDSSLKSKIYGGLKSHSDHNETTPTPTSVAMFRAVHFAKKFMRGMIQVTLPERFLKTATTAHILGGCLMATSKDKGVVDSNCKVFGYDNLYVIDGSVIPVNLGLNPSLTIAAIAEHAMSQIGKKGTT